MLQRPCSCDSSKNSNYVLNLQASLSPNQLNQQLTIDEDKKIDFNNKKLRDFVYAKMGFGEACD